MGLKGRSKQVGKGGGCRMWIEGRIGLKGGRQAKEGGEEAVE